VAKTTLKRLPSSVYWQGLSIWGIRTFRGAQAQYHRSLDRYYAQLTRHGGRASERDVEHDDLISPNWHAGLIPPPPDFPTECSLSLTRREAEYLAERIRLSPACSGSLLAELVAQRRRSADVPFVWEHPHSAELPPKLREMLDHAQNFSEVMHGAPLLYNLILAEQDHRDERCESTVKISDRVGTIGLSERSHVLANGTESVSGNWSVLSIRGLPIPRMSSSIRGGISPWRAMQPGCAIVRPPARLFASVSAG
jgi:hypothetical protein